MTWIVAILPDRQSGTGEMSLKDIMVKLSELHQLTQSSMEEVFRALWPKENLPEDQFTLAHGFKEHVSGFETWKVSACREGAREAWAMVKTHYPSHES